MTVWDKIYKKYKKDKQTWATLTEGIHPLFIIFLDNYDFKIKHVLDIGCGTGKYLKFLQKENFITDGIDSSQTAIEMTKKILGNQSKIDQADMFTFKIPPAKYDLIISISTIHHGEKETIKKLINKIYRALVKNGKIFITLPDIATAEQKGYLKNRQEITTGVYVPLSGPEKGYVHSMFNKKEVEDIFY